MNEQGSGVPVSFWIISIVALVWNLLGVLSFIGAMSTGALGAMAIWGAAAFGVAVFCGAIGCILLLVKRAVAEQVFILSLIGVIIQMVHNLGVQESTEVYGPGEYAMIVMIPAVAAFLIWYARHSKAKGWIS